MALAAGWEEKAQTGEPLTGLQSNGEAPAPEGWGWPTQSLVGLTF